LPDDPTVRAPADVRAAVDARVNDARFVGNDVSISVWVDGWGEVAARDPDLRLLPASNQKLLTAMGAFEVLGTERRFQTTVLAEVSPVNGVIEGDVVLVAGGDPTLRRTGPHSLAALARQLRARGITEVRGPLLVDESHFDARRDAEGWLDWQRPAYAGALSALIVDDNQYRGDAAFLADPARFGVESFREALVTEGITVAGPTAHTSARPGTEVARLASAPIGTLVDTMLMQSDNMIAESLVKEVDVAGGGPGGTAGGLSAIHEALDARCIPTAGMDADGSGLSRANGRSAREWRRLLLAARAAPWSSALTTSLPLAGRSGTLAGRLTNMSTAGNVRAKTGTIIPGRALSGYLTTAGGRPAVFSLVVNGANPAPTQAAIDALVTTIASTRG
jgi:D-alanyl-D-alanine carboxypeptidase/D-alanyl-D-alanine-endopeptidase (penicillin-binding protein 4)